MSNNTPPQTYVCLSVFQAERCGPSLTRYPLPDQPTRHFSDSLFRHARPPSLFQTLPGCAWSVLSFLFALSAPPRFPSGCPSQQIACSRVESDDYYHVKSIMSNTFQAGCSHAQALTSFPTPNAGTHVRSPYATGLEQTHDIRTHTHKHDFIAPPAPGNIPSSAFSHAIGQIAASGWGGLCGGR